MSIRVCRLFFWFDGASEDRPGGPWWYRDFLSDEQRLKFLGDVERVLHRYVCCDITDIPYKVDEASKGVIYIYPPPTCPEGACKHIGSWCQYCGWSK